MTYPTLTERKRAKVARMNAAVEELARDLATYAREHGGRYVLFGSAARGDMRHDSDVDVMIDFPTGLERQAWDYAEESAFALGLRPDLHLRCWKSEAFLAQVDSDAAGKSVTDKVWTFILDSADSAERHFAAAAGIFDRGGFAEAGEGYVRVMALLHAMQSGHTSLESALTRIHRVLDEDRPIGARWHEELLDVCGAERQGVRPAILPASLVGLAHETRAFRHLAMHSYDIVLDEGKARIAVEAARRLGPLLRPALERFRAARQSG